MSKITNPESESSVTCGFYNSLNDRKYNSVQISEMFDGIINDGIFASIGSCFVVNATVGNVVTVGTGKAWFNHTWTKNDATLPITCDESEVLLNRIDAVVIEVNRMDSVRDNFIKVIKGVPASEPVNPSLANDNGVYQYPLGYIYRAANSTNIAQADITNMVGTTETPFVTGLMQTTSLDTLLGQWRDELDQFVQNETEDFEIDYLVLKNNMEAAAAVLTAWTENEQVAFTAWFDSIKNQLDGDAAANLLNQINALNDSIENLIEMLDDKVDKSTIINSTSITGDGKIMDGATCSQALAGKMDRASFSLDGTTLNITL